MLDHSTLDLGSVRLRAKDGLRFALRRRGTDVWYLVEDEVSGHFYRVGIPAATLLSLLDGRRTVRDALALAAQFSDEAHLDEVAASGICNFLLHSGLISTSESRSTERLDRQTESQVKAKRIQWLNPISITVPLFNPDRFLSLLNRSIGFAIGWPLAILGTLAILFGAIRLWMDWDELTLHRLRAYSATDWLWFAVGWLVVKLIHEIGHGLVCKRLGGSVPQAGVALLLFIPLPFINTTSAWSFARRSHRMAVVAAGVFFEMLMASLAIAVWSNLAPGPWRFHLEDIILASMIHTLVFNLNPLMKFDGYYLLTDFLELNNLAQQGKKFVSSLAMKWFVDPQTEIPQESRLQTFVRVYGVAAKVWMTMVMLGLFFAACNLFEGVGLLMATMALTLWSVPLVRGIKNVFWMHGRWHRRRLKRLSISLGSLAAALLLIGIFVPAPPSLRAPMVVDYREKTTLRATAPGFIKSIHVQPNQTVRKGELLIEISNPELVLRRDAVAASIKKSEIEMRVAHDEQEIAKAVVLQEKTATLKEQLAELDALVAGLSVYAAMDGEITTHDLAQRAGKYLHVGDEIVSLGDSSTLEAVALVKQVDVRHIDLQKDHRSRVEILGVSTIADAKVAAVAPRASSILPHAAFAASHGGMLSVIAADSKEIRSGGSLGSSEFELTDVSAGTGEGFKLAEPYVKVRLELTELENRLATQFRSGQIGYAYICAREESLGGFLMVRASRWLRNQFTRSHGF